MAAKPKAKRKGVVQQPTTAVAGGVTLTSLVPFLPPQYQSYGYIAAAALGVLGPVLAQRAQRSEDK